VSAALDRLREAMGEAIVREHERLGDATVVVARERLAEALRFLHSEADLDFDVLSDLTAVDHYSQEHPRTPRFEVVYHLYSIVQNHRLRVKVEVSADDAEVASSVSVWPAADWMEREVFDLYGIRFDGHPDLRRILLYEEFEGHPLRKDYPKTRRQPLVGPQN
jgi:NADH-quinone oxidoreductase subunit C